MVIKVGDKIPSIEMHLNFPPKKINMADYVKGRKVVIVGLPGAFTPTWSTRQVSNVTKFDHKCRLDFE